MKFKLKPKNKVDYDNEKKIKSIESIKAPKVTFTFSYNSNSINVLYARKGKSASVEYIFSHDKNKFIRKTKSKEKVYDIELITPGLEIKEVIETPMAQMLYNERILKYDDNGRLVFFLDINYNDPQGNTLVKDPWGEIVTITY